MALKQDHRLLQISGAPFTTDNVLLTGLSGHEAISRLSSFQLELTSSLLDLDAAKLIGKPLRVKISAEDGSGNDRYIHGYVNRFSAGDSIGEASAARLRTYRAELVPWLWFLTQTARNFIYFPEKEEKSIYEIIEAVFDRAESTLQISDAAEVDLDGIAPLKDRLVKHCVQYRETDFNFVSRICEQYGVYYYFADEASQQKLVLSVDANYPDAIQSSIKYPEQTVSNKSSADHINSWEHSFEFVSGKFAHTDYNFEKPSQELLKDSGKISTRHSGSDPYEVYDYPGEYQTPSQGSDDAKIRQQAEEVPHDTVRAMSGCRGLAAGHCFNLEPRGDGSLGNEPGRYLVTSVHHHAAQATAETGGSGGPTSYTNSFSCVPAAVQFRPARVTPKPVVSGIQTGVVVGKQGEEIEVDRYGRIKVAFHWDRQDADRDQPGHDKVKDGDKFFCWIRVAQNIAGNKWGFMAIPRIGQEVVVDFLDGDPDRPLVIGGVYNDEQMPPYDPEEYKTRTYLKTNSSPGGDGYNELRFEDKTDQEQIFVHAERNMDVRVKNDSMELIYGNRHQRIGYEDKEGEKGGDQREEILKDRHQKVHNDHVEQIGGNMQLLVGGGDGDGNREVVIKKDDQQLVEGDQHRHVMGNNLEAIDGNRNTAVGGDQVVDVTGSSAHIAGADHLLKGMNISIEGQAICLKSGGNSITIDPSGVTIVGTLLRLNSGPAAPVISQAAMLQSQSPTDAQEAQPTEPNPADNHQTGNKSAPE